MSALLQCIFARSTFSRRRRPSRAVPRGPWRPGRLSCARNYPAGLLESELIESSKRTRASSRHRCQAAAFFLTNANPMGSLTACLLSQQARCQQLTCRSRREARSSARTCVVMLCGESPSLSVRLFWLEVSCGAGNGRQVSCLIFLLE